MDQHYSYKPDTIAWVIHEQLPHLCVVDVERLAEAIEAQRVDAGAFDKRYQEGYGDGIAAAVAAVEAL